MKEIWRDIPNYENSYQVSNLGKVRSKTRKIKNNGTYGGLCTYRSKMLKQHIDRSGYYFVSLRLNGTEKPIRVHKIVASVFLENKNNYKEINHIDGNKLNNKVNNLEFCTHQHNMQEAWRLNLISKSRKFGKEHFASKPILQYDLNGKFLKEWECIRQIERELKIWNQNISKCCKGKYKTCGGYIWRYKDEIN